MGIIQSNEGLLFSDFCNVNTGVWIRLTRFFGWKDPCNVTNLAIHWYFRPQTHEAMQTDDRNRIIQDFIETIYESTNSFYAILRLLLVDSKFWASVYFHRKEIYSHPIFKDMDDVEKHTSKPIKSNLLEQILRYAFVNELKYSDGRTLENMIDFPLEPLSISDCTCVRRSLYVALYHNLPHVVRLLLNYGARIPYEDVCSCREVRSHSLCKVLDAMKKVLISGRVPNVLHYKKRLTMCLKTLLVDISHTSELWKLLSDVLADISGGDDEVEMIPPLKHIARSQIRLCMKSNRSICKEHVLDNLGLPVTLVDFLKIDERMSFLEMYPVEEMIPPIQL